MKIAISELEHLREEIKNCHRIIKDLQKKREFVGLTEEEKIKLWDRAEKRGAYQGVPSFIALIQEVESKLKDKNL